jgi:hypothetical protein
MIQKLYIIENSGICYYFINFLNHEEKDISFDPNNISGFFSALIQFGDNTLNTNVSSNGELQYIYFKNSSFYFTKKDNLLLIIETSTICQTLSKSDLKEFLLYCDELYKEYVRNNVFSQGIHQLAQDISFEQKIKAYLAKIYKKSLLGKKTIISSI